MKLKFLDQLQVGYDKIQEKLDLGYRMRFYLSYASFISGDEFKEERVYLEQFINEKGKSLENTDYDMGLDKLKDIMEVAVKYYSNIVPLYNRNWNELRHDRLYTFKEGDAFTGGFTIMSMSNGCGNGVFQLYMSFTKEDVLIDEANKYKSPYREELLSYIENDFRPSLNDFKSVLFNECNDEENGIYDLLLRAWRDNDVEENCAYKYSFEKSLQECMEQAESLINVHYPQYKNDLSVELTGDGVQVINTYLDEKCGLRIRSKTEYWSECI